MVKILQVNTNIDLLLEFSQALHQAALTPGSIVLMDDAFFSGLVQSADRLHYRSAGLFGSTFANRNASFLHKSTGTSTVNAVAYAAFLVLLVAFDLRLNVCQNILQKSFVP